MIIFCHETAVVILLLVPKVSTKVLNATTLQLVQANKQWHFIEHTIIDVLKNSGLNNDGRKINKNSVVFLIICVLGLTCQ